MNLKERIPMEPKKMTLPFTNINRCLWISIFLILTGTSFSYETFSKQKNIFNLPNNMGQIFWTCEHDRCNTYLKMKNKNVTIIAKKSSAPSIVVLNEKLSKLFYSCGSPCNYTIFYDFKRGISRSFEFVVAVAPKQEIVVLAEKNHLVAYSIFSNIKKPLFRIEREWSPTATLFSAIIEAKFINDGLYIKYLKGNNFEEKEEVFYIKAEVKP